MHQVICIKLTTGEDLIAKVSSSTLTGTDPFATTPYGTPAGEVTLSSIRVISLQPVSRTEMGVSLVPWLLADYDAEVKIDLAKHAAVVYPPRPDLHDSYVASVSPLEVVSKPKIQTLS